MNTLKNILKKIMRLFAFYFVCSATVTNAQFVSGKLYFSVLNTDAIPLITGQDIQMPNQTLLTIFQSHHLTEFTKAFPLIDSFPAGIRHGLDKVYIASCDCDEQQLLEEMGNNNNGNYQYIEKIPIAEPLYTPNDYTLQGTDYALDLMNVQGAWDITYGNPNISIGIIDQGFDITQEDLVNQIVELGLSTNPGNPFHGTFVAGCAAAQTDNGIGKSGVGFNCKLRLSAWYNNFDWITPSMQFALHGARVFNYSFKVGCSPTAVHQSFCDLMFDYGCVLVSAAGNGTSGTYCNGGPQPGNNGYVYPASYNHVISVSGVDQYYQHYPTIGGNSYTHNDKVDICAPAYSVLSLGPSNTYIPSSGTSFSSPYVAGVAALILSVNPCLNGDQVLDIIQQTAFDIYPYQTNSPVSLAGLLGAGLVDAGAAVAYAQTASYPQFIMGSPDLCAGSLQTYAFHAPVNSMYSWNITGGSVISQYINTFNNYGYAAVDWGTNTTGGNVALTVYSSGIACPAINFPIASCSSPSYDNVLYGEKSLCNSNLLSFYITPPPNSTVVWSVTGGTIIAQSNNCSPTCSVIINWSNAGGAVTAAVTTGGTTTYQSKNVKSCCLHPFSDGFYTDATLTNTLALAWDPERRTTFNGTITIQGTIYLDGIFFMGEDAKIIVPPGSEVKLIRAQFKACNSNMWDGIYLNGTASKLTDISFVQYQNVIEDAKNAVLAENGAPIDIFNGIKFNKNYKDVILKNYSSQYFNDLGNCKFTCEDEFGNNTTLLAPFAGQRSSIGIELSNMFNAPVANVTFKNHDIGIYSNNSTSLITGCDFDNGHFGINALSSNITAKNNHFINITNLQGTLSGHAIFADAQGNNSLNLIVGGTGTNDYNTIENSFSGVFARNNINVDIQRNYFTNASTNSSMSCRVVNNTSTNIFIKDNYFNGFGTGIFLRDITASTVTVQANKFNLAGTTWGTYAIRFWNTFPPNPANQTTISGNAIKNINRTGIMATNNSFTYVNNYNTITFEDAAPAQGSQTKRGVQFQNSHKGKIESNTVQRTGGVNSNSNFDETRWGISNETSNSNFISSNLMKRIGIGARYYYSNQNTITCNNLYGNRIGVRMESSKIGDQPYSAATISQDNQWNNIAGVVLWDIQQLGTTYSANWFSKSPSTPWTPQLINPAIINFLYAPSSGTCQLPCVPPCDQHRLASIVREEDWFLELPEEEQYNLKKYVYSELVADTMLMHMSTDDDALLTAFYDSVKTTPLGQLVDAGKILPTDTTTAHQLVSIVNPDNNAEWNQKVVYEIYLETIARSIYEFTPEQYETLFNIANQDPIFGGTAVYSARVMIDLDVDDFTTEEGFRLASNKPKDNFSFAGGFTVKPNPTKESFKILLKNIIDENRNVKIYNAFGQLVSRFNVSENEISVSTEKFRSGIYTILLLSGDKIIKRQKISIIK